MLNILYTLLIYPIELIIELSFVSIFRVLKNTGFSIIGLSVFVSTAVLPLFIIAEKQQKKERDIQNKMKEMKDNINAVFIGDKRYMLLSALYRQHSYHPLYALRGSLGLLIQVPFFIAAYHFLSNLNILSGRSFFFIKDLGAPDAFLNGINILPFIMTLANIISTFIYTKGQPAKDKIQLYGMAALFLILLYNSPSSLVLYWTCNNLYSLAKNILQKIKYSRIIVAAFIYIALFSLSIYLIFFHNGNFFKRLLIAGFLFIIMLIPVWKKFFSFIACKIKLYNMSIIEINKIFFLSLTGLFLLIGLFNPSSLIASSVDEFSYLSHISSPLGYIGLTVLQTAGIAMWLIFIYFLFDKKIKTNISLLLTVILAIFIFNSLTFSNQYEHMLPDLTFAGFKNLPVKQDIINLLLIFIVCIITFFIFIIKRKFILFSIQIILISTLFIFGLFNVFKINNEFKNILPSTNNTDIEFEKQFTFSKTGKNILVIILDRAVSGYIPVIFEEKPELLDSFNGFSYYPNTVSSGRFSLHGFPPTFGGYYYSAYEIQKRNNESQWNKIFESTQILPRILANSGFHVICENLPWINPSVFNDIENIKAETRTGRYSHYFNISNDLNLVDYYDMFKNLFIRFSFFKASPLILHEVLYDKGNYLSYEKNYTGYSKYFIDHYSTLYYLSNTTYINDNYNNYANILVSELPHAPGFLQVPEYFPSKNVTNTGDGPFSNEDNYHVNMSSFILLAKWFDYLKENGVYNNTRIIIASDHGNHYIGPVPNDIRLPNDRWLRHFNSILLVKDFNEDSEFKLDNTFMTNADIPHIAAEGLVERLINPFTGEELKTDKENGFYVTSNMYSQTGRMNRNTYNIRPNEWLHVHTNIFDPANWRQVNFE